MPRCLYLLVRRVQPTPTVHLVPNATIGAAPSIVKHGAEPIPVRPVLLVNPVATVLTRVRNVSRVVQVLTNLVPVV